MIELDEVDAYTRTAVSLMNKSNQQEFILRRACIARVLTGRKTTEMGGILEHQWRNKVNTLLCDTPYEMAWMPGHSYNDAILLFRGTEWDCVTRDGESARYECKTLNLQSDEAKAHFDPLVHDLREQDKLLVFTWIWEDLDTTHVFPCIKDFCITPALPIAKLRDFLHLLRGGTFVDPHDCPDGCLPHICTHGGEPLNAKGNRERQTGPNSRTTQCGHAANFGGLQRMLKARSASARVALQDYVKAHPETHSFIEFMERNGLVKIEVDIV